MEKRNNIAEIIEAFKIFDGKYKREHVDAAIVLGKEIVPYLIGILENVLADPDAFIEIDGRFDHVYALMLLGHFRESKSHNVIIDMFSLPDNIPDELFGDITTDDLPGILLRTCGGSVEQIKSMATNREVDDYCRISAIHAMAYAVVEGIASREEVLSFYGTLFTGDETDEDSDFWSLLANFVCDLYPEELMDTIEKAYDDGLIVSGIIGYGDFDSALEVGKVSCLERLRIDLDRRSLDDIHNSMSWWACFDEEPQFYSAQDPEDLIKDTYLSESDQSTQINKKKRDKTKRKRKQAKASRRKNRR